MTEVTTHRAKKLLKQFLVEHGLPHSRLTAKTVSFSGFGYGDRVSVTVHGWTPDPRWDAVEQFAREHGFSARPEQTVYAACNAAG